MTVPDATWDPRHAPWVERLVREVCEAEGVPLPRKLQTWRAIPARDFTTGMHRNPPATRSSEHWSWISLTIGTDLVDAKMVALHELAHHVMYEKLGQADAHSERFWQTAWRLFVRYDVVDKALERETKYKVGASDVAEAMGIVSSDGRAASSFRRQPVAAAASMVPAAPRSMLPKVGEVAETFGMRDKWNGMKVVVVKHRDTKSLVRLLDPVDRFPAGKELLVPMRCLRPSGIQPARKMRYVTVEVPVEYLEGEDWKQKLPAGAKVVSATVEYDR